MFSATFSKLLVAVAVATMATAAPAGSSAPVVGSAISVTPVSSAPAVASSVALPSSVIVASSVAIPSSIAVVSSAAAASSDVGPSSAPAASSAASLEPPSTLQASGTSIIPASETVAPASDNPNAVLWSPELDGGVVEAISGSLIEPIRGTLGATVIGPQNTYLDYENPDLLAPPSTDAGTVGSAKWPFSLSHNRLQTGGWARQQNIAVMPMATEMAGVNMRLQAGAIRELHWHSAAEWAYVLKGSVQVSAVNTAGQNYLGTVAAGDLWYFPAGIPHSIQATNDDPDGSEFLLVFDDGNFSEDDTFLLTDWLAHTPKEVIAKNFQTDISAFDSIPGSELYIFPAPLPGPDSDEPVSPQGSVPSPFTFQLSQMQSTTLSGGSVKVVDSHVFPVSTTIAAAEVTVEPGAMRELHWHPTQDEWSYFIEGAARVTLFASQGSARTFNYLAGDVGYVPGTYGHYVENIGNTTLRFLEIFRTDTFQDMSLNQWLALTPAAMVQETLNLSDETMSHLNPVKQTVVGPASSSSNATSS